MAFTESDFEFGPESLGMTVVLFFSFWKSRVWHLRNQLKCPGQGLWISYIAGIRFMPIQEAYAMQAKSPITTYTFFIISVDFISKYLFIFNLQMYTKKFITYV